MAKLLDPNDEIDRAAYLIFGLHCGDYTPEEVRNAFDDEQPWRFFKKPDSALLEFLISTHGGAVNDADTDIKFKDCGKQRAIAINAMMPPVALHKDSLPTWAAHITREYKKTQGCAIMSQAMQLISNGGDPEAILTQAAADLSNLAVLSKSNDVMSSIVVGEQTNHLIESYVGLRSSRTIPTGFAAYDEHVPLERGKKLGVGGVPGSGKTTLIHTMVQHAAQKGYKSLFLCEMQPRDMMLRAGLRETRIINLHDLQRLRRPITDLENAIRENEHNPTKVKELNEKLRYHQAKVRENKTVQALIHQVNQIAKRSVMFRNASGLDARKILATMRRAENEMGGLDIMILDHIQLAHVVPRKNDRPDHTQKIRTIYRDIMQYVIPEFPDVAYVILQHLNKGHGRVVDEQIFCSQEDFVYGGHQEMDTGIIIVRELLHKDKLAFTDEKIKGWKQNDPERYDTFQNGGIIHIVKGRNTAPSQRIYMTIDGEHFHWQEAIITDKERRAST